MEPAQPARLEMRCTSRTNHPINLSPSTRGCIGFGHANRQPLSYILFLRPPSHTRKPFPAIAAQSYQIAQPKRFAVVDCCYSP